jgi:putative transcriptional regulator
MLQYKINILEELKQRGYTTYTLRKEKLLGESTIQKLRNNLPVSWENLEVLCGLLDCNIGDIIEYTKHTD